MSFTASGRRRSRPGFERWIPFAWIPMVLAALTVLVQGLAATLRDDPFYRNYWGGLLYGPLAIALGVLLLILIPYFEIRRRKRMGEAGSNRQAKKSEGPAESKPNGAFAMLGFASRFRRTRRTSEWTEELREGEK